ncbi:hypothetical protein ACEUA8_01535 [Aeromonas veronii]
MTLPASGNISLDQIATEMGISNVNLELGDSRLRAFANKASGDISLSDFYGLTYNTTPAVNILDKEYTFSISSMVDLHNNDSEDYYHYGFAKTFSTTSRAGPWYYNLTPRLNDVNATKPTISFSSTNKLVIPSNKDVVDDGMLLAIGGASSSSASTQFCVVISGHWDVKNIKLKNYKETSTGPIITQFKTLPVNTSKITTFSTNRKVTVVTVYSSKAKFYVKENSQLTNLSMILSST